MPIKIIKKIKKKITFFLIILFWKKRKGRQKKVTETKLNAYVPINDSICIDSIDHDQVYEIKFQGKPVSKFPLKYSKIENDNEKSKIKLIFFSEKCPTINIASPKNIDKKKGIKVRATGIKFLKISSCVNDTEIQ